ncbi:hypothetical protein, partial [Acinetobacter baumannii]|uniref:hypothetical protein n=1 Tax=Acinetobacter baumannii TaxID=470 RepID=UPI001AEC9DF2
VTICSGLLLPILSSPIKASAYAIPSYRWKCSYGEMGNRQAFDDVARKDAAVHQKMTGHSTWVIKK